MSDGSPAETTPPPSSPGKFPFTKVGGVVIAGVVLVAFGLLFEGPRRRRAEMACIAHLQQIDGVSQSWALENKKAATDTYSLTDTTMLAYLRGSVLPVCPRGGTYSPGTNFLDVPKCNIPGHRLLYPTLMGGYPR